MLKEKIILLLLLLVMTPSPAAAGEPDIFIDGEKADFPDVCPYVTAQGRTMIPLRFVAENLGAQVQWFGDTSTVRIEKESAVIDLRPDESNTLVNGIPGTVDVPPEIKNGRMMVPLRFVSENLGTEVSWQEGRIDIVSVLPDTADRGVLLSRVEDTDPADFSIMGEAVIPLADTEAFLRIREETLQQDRGSLFRPFPENIAAEYYRLGEKYGIRGDVALAQALWETAYFQYTGDVQWTQNNYCGLWATGTPLTGSEPCNGADGSRLAFIPGTHGITFADVSSGVEAHLQHLYAYASCEDLPGNTVLLDPRFKYVTRGVASVWPDLNGKWAVPGDGYGEGIINRIWKLMCS